MADFTPNSTTKSAIRKLANPLADVTAFDSIVQGVIANNPFQCVGYPLAGVNHPPVERTRQGYTTRIVYQDADAKTVAIITARAATIAGFTSVANQLREREVRLDPEMPRCERRGLLPQFQQGAGDPHLVLGRSDPEQSRDLGRHRGGTGLNKVKKKRDGT
jgi:hypothetical protein